MCMKEENPHIDANDEIEALCKMATSELSPQLEDNDAAEEEPKPTTSWANHNGLIRPWELQAFRLIANGEVKTTRDLAERVKVNERTIRKTLSNGGAVRKMFEGTKLASLTKQARNKIMNGIITMTPSALGNIKEALISENEAVRMKNSWNIVKEINGTSQPKIDNRSIKSVNIRQTIYMTQAEKVSLLTKRLSTLQEQIKQSAKVVEAESI